MAKSKWKKTRIFEIVKMYTLGTLAALAKATELNWGKEEKKTGFLGQCLTSPRQKPAEVDKELHCSF